MKGVLAYMRDMELEEKIRENEEFIEILNEFDYEQFMRMLKQLEKDEEMKELLIRRRIRFKGRYGR